MVQQIEKHEFRSEFGLIRLKKAVFPRYLRLLSPKIDRNANNRPKIAIIDCISFGSDLYVKNKFNLKLIDNILLQTILNGY
jgi:hypothetical protein